MENNHVQETIKKLLIVQERDCRIRRYLNELNDIPVRKKAIETTTEQHREATERAKDTLKTQQAAIHKLDVEIQTERAQVAKLRDQQFQVKSNDEYRALNNEIAHTEEKIRGLEDKEIELMEDLEQAEAVSAEIRSEWEREEAGVRQELQQLAKRGEALEQELKQTEKDRDMLSSGIDESWLTRYNQIMANRQDVVLVRMEQNGTCGSCHMKLPPQMTHDVRKAYSMVSCSYCSRLLYWARE